MISLDLTNFLKALQAISLNKRKFVFVDYFTQFILLFVNLPLKLDFEVVFQPSAVFFYSKNCLKSIYELQNQNKSLHC